MSAPTSQLFTIDGAGVCYHLPNPDAAQMHEPEIVLGMKVEAHRDAAGQAKFVASLFGIAA